MPDPISMGMTIDIDGAAIQPPWKMPPTTIRAAGYPGVYLTWDRASGSGTLAFYQILRSESPQGEFDPIITLPWPQNDYIDPQGTPRNWYKIVEIDNTNTVVGITPPMPGEELLVKMSLIYEIYDYLHMQVIDDRAEFDTSNRNTGRFSHYGWNTQPWPEIRVSAPASDGNASAFQVFPRQAPITQTQNSGANYASGLTYQLDFNGRIWFYNTAGAPAAVDPADIVTASYDVRMFSASQLNSALYLALQDINAQPGTNKVSSLAQAPFYYDPCIIDGAMIRLLRQLLNGMSNQMRRLLIEGDGVMGKNGPDMIAKIRDDLKGYQETYKDKLKDVATARYPRSGTMVAEVYQFPGGRSRMFRSIFGIGGGY